MPALPFLLSLGLSALISLYPFIFNLSSLVGIEESKNVSERQIILNLCAPLQNATSIAPKGSSNEWFENNPNSYPYLNIYITKSIITNIIKG